MVSGSVVVVGGGVTGAFAAYSLARKGADVVLVDRDDQSCRASSNNPGGINPLHGPGIPGAMSQFALHCYRKHLAEWPTVANASTTNFRGRTVARICVAITEEDVERLKQNFVLYENTEGFSAEWLNAATLRKVDSRISEEALGGLWTEGNACVNASRYNRALVEASRAQGVETIRGKLSRLE